MKYRIILEEIFDGDDYQGSHVHDIEAESAEQAAVRAFYEHWDRVTGDYMKIGADGKALIWRDDQEEGEAVEADLHALQEEHCGQLLLLAAFPLSAGELIEFSAKPTALVEQ